LHSVCTTVSFLGEGQTVSYPKRRLAIREGRYRTPTGSSRLGFEIGRDDPTEAARIFDRLKGVSWRGDYVRWEEGWVAAWVIEVIR
jgi:hypothetical protein